MFCWFSTKGRKKHMNKLDGDSCTDWWSASLVQHCVHVYMTAERTCVVTDRHSCASCGLVGTQNPMKISALAQVLVKCNCGNYGQDRLSVLSVIGWWYNFLHGVCRDQRQLFMWKQEICADRMFNFVVFRQSPTNTLEMRRLQPPSNVWCRIKDI